MLEKLTLFSHERLATKMLMQDDFNYNPFNEGVFSLNLMMDSDQSSNADDDATTPGNQRQSQHNGPKNSSQKNTKSR